MKSLLARIVLTLAFAVTAVAGLVAFRHSGFGVVAAFILTYLSVLVLLIAILLTAIAIEGDFLITFIFS